MRILVENSGYDLDNLGDACMLQVLFERLRSHFPGAEFGIITRDSRRLARYCEGAHPVPAEHNHGWNQVRNLYTRFRRAMPRLETLVRMRTPGLQDRLQRLRARRSIAGNDFGGAELFVVAGGGFITDVFRSQAWAVLERLDASLKAGATVALFGQGIGPLRDPALLKKAREVLPRANLIALREKLTSLPILKRVGVPLERIFVTGDDAIEPTYLTRREEAGEYLGVNLRVAGYARVRREMIGAIRKPLQEAARRLKSHMMALPVSANGVVESSSDVSDVAAAEELIDGSWNSERAGVGPGDPNALIERVGKCRVVVTGSYHAAVFALSQGIQAVCLTNSEYYELKFRGLADQFGAGVEVLSLSDSLFSQKLVDKTVDAWACAESLRPRLLRAAERQLSEGRAAYAHLREIVEARC
ncbi:MAG TPA: polysaccharide pyruvyl transferase family protein [Pyrinomonadaceae bacterium]|nr:polysaccharide pyruvyl transferase family protein [Pyrinomonadaceae bacterium]